MRTLLTCTISLVIFLVLSFLLPALHAQSREWDIRFGGGGDDLPFAIVGLDNGVFITGGASCSGKDGDKSEVSRGKYDFWIVLGTKDGATWDKSFGGPENDLLVKIISLPDGFLLGGSSRSGQAGDKTAPPRGDWDYWLVKTDASGNKMWDRAYGGADADMLMDVIAIPGGFLLAGTSLSGAGADKTEPSKGGWDYWLVKTDASGNKIWDRSYGGTKDDNLAGIVERPGGGFALAGSSNSDAGAGKTQNSYGGKDFWVVLTDANGIQTDDFTFGGDQDEKAADLVTTGTSLIIGGWSVSGISGNKSAPMKGGRDFWVTRIDASGSLEWDQSYGGLYDDELTSIGVRTNGHLQLAGFTNSVTGDATLSYPQGNTDYWLLETDSSGIPVQYIRTGGLNGDFLTAISTSVTSGNDSLLLLTGYSSSGAGASHTQDSQGALDFWVVQVNQVGVSTSEPGAQEPLALLAYPNPFTTDLLLNLRGEDSGEISLRLYDITGRLVWTKSIYAPGNMWIAEQIRLADLPPGQYLLEARSTQKNTSLRLLKQ